ncbi:methyl-accepting chemotaxis protein [Undibacterium terreum]|uniref:Methyl-accepting chemotaxis protein n=1 Tax=Undibacterium terreum TaxID=1224302 RepID=A0A916XDN4_9BURK|nr:methyl-accepting chemotaxis protein [Undibacterium terreum]GGC62979.1 methyl-accepting chemotaxis protein [Undibacterium terreum]
MKFSNIKIGSRLAIAFGLLTVLMLGISAIGINRLSSNAESTKRIVFDRYAKVAMVNEIKSRANIGARALTAAVLAPNEQSRQQALQMLAESSKANTAAYDKLKNAIVSEEGKALLKTQLDAREKYSAVRNKAIKLLNEGNKEEAATVVLKDISDLQADYFAQVDKMVAFQEERMSADSDEGLAQANMAETLMIVLSGISVLLAVSTGVFITRSITRPINNAVDLAEAVANGDLTRQIEITSTDETGRLLGALKRMNNSLQSIVSQVRAGTDTIATASSQIAAGNLDLSSRTEEQASSLEETASAMEELTSTVKQNADNARQASQLAASASQVAVSGGKVVGQVIDTMGSINDSSKKIVDIISVIDGIAFQTNILALNAAVEAARAGEQGRGFAVVASEVRNLAQRSASAAKEIKTLISDSVDKVDTGSKLVEQAGQTMDEVVASVQRVTDVVSEISAASQEQSTGIEQVNLAIAQMDEVTQQNAALVEEAAAASQSMQDQAANLVEVVSIFKVDATAGKTAAHRPQVVSSAAMRYTPETAQLKSKPAARAAISRY